MPRFHFDLIECGECTQDDDGTDLPSTSSAKEMAVRSARHILAEHVIVDGCLWLDASIVVRHRGTTVFTLEFGDAITIKPAPRH